MEDAGVFIADISLLDCCLNTELIANAGSMSNLNEVDRDAGSH